MIEIPSGAWTSSEMLDEILGIDSRFERTLEGWRGLIHPDDRALVSACFRIEVIGEGKRFDREFRIVRKKDQAERWVRGLGEVEFDDSGKNERLLGTVQDITAQKKSEEHLQKIAHYDSLTGLPNRALLTDRMQLSMAQLHRRNKRMAIACLDLDGFRAVDECHGRETGDELLLALANRMKQVLRKGDTLARLGGDEFAVVVNDLAKEGDSVPTFARLLNAASEPILIGSAVLHVSASIGVAYYPQAAELDADQLVRQARHAMFQAKILGENRFHIFDPVLNRAVRGHHENLERIRKARRMANLKCTSSPRSTWPWEKSLAPRH